MNMRDYDLIKMLQDISEKNHSVYERDKNIKECLIHSAFTLFINCFRMWSNMIIFWVLQCEHHFLSDLRNPIKRKKSIVFYEEIVVP